MKLWAYPQRAETHDTDKYPNEPVWLIVGRPEFAKGTYLTKPRLRLCDFPKAQ